MRGLSLLVQIQPLHWCDSPDLTVWAAVIVALPPLSGHAFGYSGHPKARPKRFHALRPRLPIGFVVWPSK
jgi:hypothetical protein